MRNYEEYKTRDMFKRNVFNRYFLPGTNCGLVNIDNEHENVTETAVCMRGNGCATND